MRTTGQAHEWTGELINILFRSGAFFYKNCAEALKLVNSCFIEIMNTNKDIEAVIRYVVTAVGFKPGLKLSEMKWNIIVNYIRPY